MKKILVLILLLGIASMATAALTLSGPTTVAENGTITITLTADAESVDDGDYGYIYVDSDSFSNITILTAMSNGELSRIEVYAYDFYFKGSDDTGQDPPYLSAGDWLTFDVTADSTTNGGTITIRAVSNLFVGDTHNITVIPEPMTIGLLGLGGLFLRRRK